MKNREWFSKEPKPSLSFKFRQLSRNIKFGLLGLVARTNNQYDLGFLREEYSKYGTDLYADQAADLSRLQMLETNALPLMKQTLEELKNDQFIEDKLISVGGTVILYSKKHKKKFIKVQKDAITGTIKEIDTLNKFIKNRQVVIDENINRSQIL